MSEHGICAEGEAIFAVMHNGRGTETWQLQATCFAEAEIEVTNKNTRGCDFLFFETKQVPEKTRQPQ